MRVCEGSGRDMDNLDFTGLKSSVSFPPQAFDT